MTTESFVSVSNDSDFPIQNIPFGIFSTSDKVNSLTIIIRGEYLSNPIRICSLTPV